MHVDRFRQCHIPLPYNHARHCPQHELYSPKKTFLMIDAVVVLAGVGLFAFIWWWGGARHYCIPPSFEDWLTIDIGPRTNTQVIVGQADLNGYNDVHTS
jgi:hypothetical protein